MVSKERAVSDTVGAWADVLGRAAAIVHALVGADIVGPEVSAGGVPVVQGASEWDGGSVIEETIMIREKRSERIWHEFRGVNDARWPVEWSTVVWKIVPDKGVVAVVCMEGRVSLTRESCETDSTYWVWVDAISRY